MGKSGAAADTIGGTAGRLRRSIVRASEAGAPRGKVVRLRMRMTFDLLITLAMVTFAVVSSTAYQVMRLWARRSDRP
jgi:hypothetical protein